MKERSKQGQTNKQTNKAKQHSTPKAVIFPRKNELPRVGLEPTTLYTLDRALYQLSYRGSSVGWAQISHLIVHLINRLTINSVHMPPPIIHKCIYYSPKPGGNTVHVIMRHTCKKEGRKKQARSNKQTRQSNTAHPRQSLFLRKMNCLGWDANPQHSTL